MEIAIVIRFDNVVIPLIEHETKAKVLKRQHHEFPDPIKMLQQLTLQEWESPRAFWACTSILYSDQLVHYEMLPFRRFTFYNQSTKAIMVFPHLKNLPSGKMSAWVMCAPNASLTEDSCLLKRHTTCATVGLDVPVVRLRLNAKVFLQ